MAMMRPIVTPGPRTPITRARPEPMQLGNLPGYKKGGTVKKTGPAIVHKGEKIIPAKKSKTKKK